MANNIMQTKLQTRRYERYRDFLKENGGCRSLYQHYNSYSDKKAAAWQRISARKCDENGFAFTIVYGGPHYFSTGYLRKVNNQVELVYDYCGGIDRIILTLAQRLELSKILCQTI